MRSQRCSFIDVVAIACLGLVIASISMVQIQQHRAVARKTGCVNNLAQLALATHNYHSAYRQMPMGSGGTTADSGSESWQSNHDRLSVWVALLPFHEEQALWEQISNPMQVDGITFPAMGPVPWYDPSQYLPWSKRPKMLACPTDTDAGEFPMVSSYVVNYGDAVHLVGTPHNPTSRLKEKAMEASNRGMFFGKTVIEFRDCLDGLSNTVMFSESCIASKTAAKNVADLAFDPSLCIAANKDPATEFWPPGRDACWADGCLRSTGFQTILPPNSPSATSDQSDLEGVMSPSSHHLGGVHIAMGDGSVRFTLNTIDAGQSDSPTVALIAGKQYALPGSRSPFGLWGAFGTRACMEVLGFENPGVVWPLPELTPIEVTALQAKPKQTWMRADGKGDIEGRFVTVSSDLMLIYLSVDGTVQRVSLAELSHADSQNATEQHDQIIDESLAKLREKAIKGIELLDAKEFTEFASALLLDGRQRNQEAAGDLVKLCRGLLTQSLEDLVREIDAPASQWIKREMSDNAPVTIRMSSTGSRVIRSLKPIYVDDRWWIEVR
ncbi:MAG: DUF1559 domain-containing protein [Pirellulaceae bacterium]